MRFFFLLSYCLGCFLFAFYSMAQPTEIYGLASPIVLQDEQIMTIDLGDYFIDPTAIVSVTADKSLKTKLSPDQQKLQIGLKTNWEVLPPLSVIRFLTRTKTEHSILLKKAAKTKHTFRLADNNYQKVQVAGQFNDWNPANSLLQKEGSEWQLTLPLANGNYQYQLVADGKWMLDPANPVSVDNNIGGFNSLIEVGKVERSLLPFLYTQQTTDKGLQIGIENGVEQLFVFWENELLSNNSVKMRIIDTEITIPSAAQNIERSTIRVLGFNKYGLSNDLYIPLRYGKIMLDAQQLQRSDWHTSNMYFMMVDRFKDGNSRNNQPLKDERVLPPANYQGGDIAGIQQLLEQKYFDQLGVNTLWVSPLVQNPMTAYQEYPAPHRYYSGYHGYWPVHLTQVDTHFGTSNELKTLVNKAHDNNMNVLLDFVSNHVHQESEIWQKHPEWFSPLELPDHRKNIRLWDEQRLTTWFDTFLPSIDHEQIPVSNMLIDTALYWLNTYQLDGFRHDAVKHIHNIFWQMLTKRLKKEVILPQKRNLYQIGETFGSRELIGSYISTGQLDAQFDFNLYFDARAVFAIDQESFEKLDHSLYETFNYYGSHSLMGNITGNHDMARFISLASGDLKFNEDPKAAGWERSIGITNPVGYDKLSMLHAFIMTIPGIPIVYYGDEIGMPGADDPDNRRMMRFDNLLPQEQAVKDKLSRLTHFRRNSMALLYGDYRPLLVTANTYAFARTYFGKTVVVVFNKSDKNQKIQLSLPSFLANAKRSQTILGNKAKYKKHQLSTTIAPRSYMIWSNE